MSADLNNHIVRRHYKAHDGDNILSQVQHVICIVTADALISAGFHPSGEVLVVHSSRYEPGQWNKEFLEQELLNDPLLADPLLIRCIYLATLKNIIIPGELFPGDTVAPQWLQSIYYCEKTEKLRVQDLGKSNASCCYAYPASVEECFTHYVSGLKFLPLNYIHFHNSVAAVNLLQCTITDRYAIATLHHSRQLHWHQTFEYSNAEDIVYRLTAACHSFGIDPHSYPLWYTATNDGLDPVLKALQGYFPATEVRSQEGIAAVAAPEWSATIRLFQQLNASCVS
jgi:hypothetical protein